MCEFENTNGVIKTERLAQLVHTLGKRQPLNAETHRPELSFISWLRFGLFLGAGFAFGAGVPPTGETSRG